jgi:hypothetical protein
MDVMLLESEPEVGRAEAELLEAAGHRVHRCHQPGEGFPCAGIRAEGTCPLEIPVDVAVVVRSRTAGEPTISEDGIACAIRAAVPIVEVGRGVEDPYGPWLAARVAPGDVDAGVVDAFDGRIARFIDDIRFRIDPLVAQAGVARAAVACEVTRTGHRLHVRVTGPATLSRLREAIAVRVYDAVRAAERTFGHVAISVDFDKEEAVT